MSHLGCRDVALLLEEGGHLGVHLALLVLSFALLCLLEGGLLGRVDCYFLDFLQQFEFDQFVSKPLASRLSGHVLGQVLKHLGNKLVVVGGRLVDYPLSQFCVDLISHEFVLDGGAAYCLDFGKPLGR